MSNAPDFIIMGAMKCATTTLHEQLEAQAGIFMSEPKEPNFFSDDDQFDRGIDYYQSLFEIASRGDICGESSTHYTKLPTYPSTVKRIYQYLPTVKLIYVMRHPVERLISQYIHEWSQKAISVGLSQALEHHPELYQYSLYSMQLRPYLETFGSENVLPVFLERLKQYPDQEFDRICQFIGYTQPARWQRDLKHQHASRERMRKSAWRDALVNAPILSDIRRHLVPQSTRDWVKGFWQMQQRPRLSDRERAWLEAKFDQDLAILGDWLGRELSCKNFVSATLDSPASWVHAKVPQCQILQPQPSP
ncbi:MAG: sulfotransferase domain-containing protein [Cyanobacteria bacterium P01_G01_bin.38]